MEKSVAEVAHTGTAEPDRGLRCRYLSVSFGDRRALDDVSLSVGSGGLTAVLGVSGSGKSTLLKAIAGFVPLAAGSVEIDARNITALPAEKRSIASLFQTARLFPALNVQSNVAFGLRVRGVPEGERNGRAADLLQRVGLGDRLLDPVTKLSGGEQQRVALARALAFTPDLVLMDEPFSAVDTPRRRVLRDLVAELIAEHQLTSLLVTHDIADAKRLADRIAVIDEGRLVQEGSVAEVLGSPVNDVVAALVAES